MLTSARREVIIANAYFFPGYRLLHAMRNAARRGVRVKLIVRGEPDIPIVKFGAHLLYHYLIKGGVQVYEYRRRPLHGKVALADDHWATVGSSNLDPLSLSLNLEANLIIHDREFNQTLRDNLNGLIARDCQQIDKSMLPKTQLVAARRQRAGLPLSAPLPRTGRLAAGAYPAVSRGQPAGAAGNRNPGPGRNANQRQSAMSKSHPRWRMAKKSADRALFLSPSSYCW